MVPITDDMISSVEESMLTYCNSVSFNLIANNHLFLIAIELTSRGFRRELSGLFDMCKVCFVRLHAYWSRISSPLTNESFFGTNEEDPINTACSLERYASDLFLPISGFVLRLKFSMGWHSYVFLSMAALSLDNYPRKSLIGNFHENASLQACIHHSSILRYNLRTDYAQ